MPDRRGILRMLALALMIAFVAPPALLAAAADAEPAPKPAARDPRTLRVMSYNIHAGRGTDGKIDIERIARIIRDADVDVAAIQEVDQGTKRSGKLDLPAELRRLTGMRGEFAKAIDHDGGLYGQLILSRHEIRKLDVVKLPNRDGEEQRIAAVAEVLLADPRPEQLVAAGRPRVCKTVTALVFV
jgi:endonuclease/exonuclease/phosphatase family metal-dependent hydrolase